MNWKSYSALLAILLFAAIAHAGGWDGMNMNATASCDCASGPAQGCLNCANVWDGYCASKGCDCGPNCANVWNGYCAEKSCGTQVHGRYHWYRRPAACGCGPTCATGACCDQYPMCDCNGPHFERVCEKCPSCLGMFKVRGFASRSTPECTSCGSSTRIIELGAPTAQPIEMMPAQPMPAAPMVPTKEAKLTSPAYRAMLPN